MNYRLGTLGLIAAMVLSFPSHAQDEESASSDEASSDSVKARLGQHLYVSPMFSYLKAADARGTDDGMGGQLSLGKSLTSGLNLELTADYLVADGKSGGGTATITGVGIGAMVFPLTSLPDLYVPIALKRGQVKENPGIIPDYGTTLFDIGLGYLLSLGDFGGYFPGAALRTEVKYRIDAHGREQAGNDPTTSDKSFYEGVASIGLLLPLGAAAAPAAPAESTEPVAVVDTGADSDGDGVTDELDQCPDTPAGTAVNESGCPLEATPVAEPSSPCETPAAGEAIDLNGCKTGDTVVLRGVNFELDSARLTANAKTILDGVADSLLAAQALHVEIGGHTSSEGSDSYNLKLSDNRAEAVRQYLLARGVEGSRLTVKGYGEGSPVADNATAEGRELNRRVELKVTEGGAAPAEAAPVEEAAPVAEAAPTEEAAAVEETAPSEEAAPVEEAAPAEAAPVEEVAPVEGEPTPVEGEPAPEVIDAQPVQ